MSDQLGSDIVERARSGDRDAFELLAQETAARLYPIARRIVRDGDMAEDVLQRTLVAIWRELPRLREVGCYQAWSHRVLVRFCGDEIRQRRRRGQSIEADRFALGSDEFGSLVDRDQLERAFRRLSAQHRAVVVLAYYRGLSGAEIASTLNISAGTVASRLHYALRHMRAAIEADTRVAITSDQPISSAVA